MKKLLALCLAAVMAVTFVPSISAEKAAIKVACIGDSITYGSKLTNRTTDCYPAQLGKLLGNSYEVQNFGASGYCMLKTSDRPFWNHENFDKVKDYQPDVILIMLGTNDAKTANWEKGKNEFANTYLEMIQHYQKLQSNPKIYALLPPCAYDDGNYEIQPDVIKNEIIPAIRQMAEKNNIPVIDVYTATSNMAANFEDKIHPNPAGAKAIAETVSRQISSDFSKKETSTGSTEKETPTGSTGAKKEAEELDLARGKKAEASSQWSDTYAADKAVDGDFETRWSAAKGETANQWVQVDLGEVKEFDEILAADYSLRVQKYVVEVSVDGKVWEEVADGGTLGNQANQPHLILFDAVQARYVKLTAVESTGEPSFWVLQVYHSAAVEENGAQLPKPGAASGTMAFTDVNGPLSKDELESFAAYTKKKYQTAKDNVGNAMAYGAAGADIDGMCMVYEITKDTRLLEPMLKGADSILYARNDQPGGDGRTVFTGRVEKAWPNKALGEPDEKYAGSENGLVLGHVAYVAECILNTPDIWEKEVPDGDPKGYGKTYLERAKTYVKMCDETLQEFLIPYYIDPQTKHERFPTDATFAAMGGASNYGDRAGSGFPWNQQWMFNHGPIHMAKAHELLGEEPEKAAQYKEIVQASLDWFLSQMVESEKDGNTYYYWYYWPKETNYHQDGGKMEDAVDAHMAYDIAGLHLTMKYGYDTISQEHMQKFANTIKYVIYNPEQAPNVFSGAVNGGAGKGFRAQLYPENIVLGLYDEEVYHILNTTNAISASVKGISRFGRILYTKAQLYGVSDDIAAAPEQQPGGDKPTDPTRPPEIDPNKTVSFYDMAGHWAKDAVTRVASAGIVRGDEDGAFRPDETLTRAQWTAMIVRLLQLEESRYQDGFQDVSAGDWYAGAVQTALDAGLIAQNRQFRPNDMITREEMSKLAASAAKKLGFGNDVPAECRPTYADTDAIGLWAMEAVCYVSYHELMTGTDTGCFEPKRNATRAEAAAVMSRMLAD